MLPIYDFVTRSPQPLQTRRTAKADPQTKRQTRSDDQTEDNPTTPWGSGRSPGRKTFGAPPPGEAVRLRTAVLVLGKKIHIPSFAEPRCRHHVFPFGLCPDMSISQQKKPKKNSSSSHDSDWQSGLFCRLLFLLASSRFHPLQQRERHPFIGRLETSNKDPNLVKHPHEQKTNLVPPKGVKFFGRHHSCCPFWTLPTVTSCPACGKCYQQSFPAVYDSIWVKGCSLSIVLSLQATFEFVIPACFAVVHTLNSSCMVSIASTKRWLRSQ